MGSEMCIRDRDYVEDVTERNRNVCATARFTTDKRSDCIYERIAERNVHG